MNRKTLLAVAVGAAMTVAMPLVQAQQAQPGPYALPSYLQNVEKDRAEVRQDSAEIRGDEKSIAQDSAKLRADEHGGNRTAVR
ncbi:MAG: hypothetical protein ACRD9W_21535, partial [Terriglobia bacterium]